MPPDLLPDTRLYVIARDDDFAFGVLHSRVHELWTLKTCSWHGVGNDPTYNVETCFETFPFPAPSSSTREEVDQAARELHEVRKSALEGNNKLTLTKLYNSHPTWLAQLHDAVDRAVLKSYGWPEDLGDEEITERLLGLNAARYASKTDG